MIWLAFFVLSLSVLLWVMLRHRISPRWFGYALLNAALAAIGLYILNSWDVLGGVSVPINLVTVTVVGGLGLPGLLLLMALKAVVI